MDFNWKKCLLFAGGFLLGTCGLKILSSEDAKTVYTNTTAAALRMKDEVVKEVETIRENAEDIAAAAREKNEKRQQAAEEAVIEDAAEVISDAAEDAAETVCDAADAVADAAAGAEA